MLLLRGAICYQLKDYQQCIAYNDRCILIDPNLAEAHANLANALQQLGNVDMAIVYYQVRKYRCWRERAAGHGRPACSKHEWGNSWRGGSGSACMHGVLLGCLE